jgi:RNA polymerase sigma-70 factor (ECF subfamily)
MIFIKIFQKLSQFSGKVPLEHWVSRIAVNTCLTQIEAERIRPELRHADLSEEEEAVVKNLATSSSDLAPDNQLASRQLVEHLFEFLKPVERLIIDLLYLQGRSIQEIHQITGMGVAAIKVRAFRARQKMKAQLTKLGVGMNL